MLLMKASLLAFVLLRFFPNTWTECICLYLRLIFPEMSSTQHRDKEEATCDLCFFFQGLFFASLCRRSPCCKATKIHLNVAEQTRTFNYLRSVRLCRGNDCPRTDVQQTVEAFPLRKRKGCSEWVAKRFFLYSIQFIFLGNNNEWIKQKNPISFMLFISWKSPRWRPFGLLL